jgi:hypothetical protein
MRRSDPLRARSPWLVPAVTALFLLLFAPSARAQSIKITSGGNATLTGNIGGGVTTQGGRDSLIVTVASFGEVGPNNPSSYVCLRQPVMIRALVPSTVRVAVTAESFGPGPSQIGKQDIGVGFVNLAPSGPNADLSATTIVPVFAADPCAAPKNADGIPQFSGTLAGVATAAPGTAAIVSTEAISRGGSLNSQSNAALVDLKVAIAPQAFRAGTVSLTLTLTLTSP